jgi:lambda family phage minor tail protein L
MPSIERQIQRLNPGALVELFVLDATRIAPSVAPVRLHNFVSRRDRPIVFQGETYTPFPIEASGFEVASNGRLPRPHIRVANLDGALQAALEQLDDLVGALVIRKRTFEHYLDGEPKADPLAEFPEDVYVVERKVQENRLLIEWELATRADVETAKIPRRQIVAGVCGWSYGGEACEWVASEHASLWFDEDDLPVSLISEDRCGKRLASCRARWGQVADKSLRFGGFPGSARVLR